LQEIFRAAEAGGKLAELRESLQSFAIGAGVYDILFRGAGPDDSGTLDADKVAENAGVVAAGSDPHQMLKQLLHEYVSFALFSMGAALGSEIELSLSRQLAPMLSALLPQG
jgi:hypothetical protein